MFCNNHFMSTYLQSNCIYLVTLGRAGLLRPRTYTLVKWAVPQDLPQYMSQIPLMRAFRAHAGMDEWRMHLAIVLLYNTDPVERRLLQSWMTPDPPVQRSGDNAAFRAEPRCVVPNWNDQRFSIQNELTNVSHNQTPVFRVSDCLSSVQANSISCVALIESADGATCKAQRRLYLDDKDDTKCHIRGVLLYMVRHEHAGLHCNSDYRFVLCTTDIAIHP
jgi:hypothetical protein